MKLNSGFKDSLRISAELNVKYSILGSLHYMKSLFSKDSACKRLNYLHIFFSILLCGTVYGNPPRDISGELADIIKGSALPSIAAAAVLDGELVSLGATGIRKLGEPDEVTINDKYHIGSCTKSMTAVLAAILVEDDELEWSSNLGSLFSTQGIHEEHRATTLRQLLTNTGGFATEIEPELWSDVWTLRGSAKSQRATFAEKLLRKTPAYPAGTQQAYSNAGFTLAGVMLERVAKQSYEDLLAKRLFEPLKMDSAGFRAPASNGKIDQPYGHSIVSSQLVSHDPEPKGDNPRAIAPAGAVHCSVIDFAKYAQFHLSDDDELLTTESKDFLRTPVLEGNYGMGWIEVERPWAKGRAYTHSGSNTMFYATIWFAPERKFAAVVMCNLGGAEASAKCDEVISFLIQSSLD